jgi:hypothetical protein
MALNEGNRDDFCWSIPTFHAAGQQAVAHEIAAVWLNVNEWLKGAAERLLVEEPGDDPTAHFGLRDWADLPPHHPDSPE